MSERRFEIPKQERIIYVKDQLFRMIQDGLKTLEARVGFSSFGKIDIDDTISFSSGSGEKVAVRVTSIREYSNIEELLSNEDLNQIVPNTSLSQAKQLASRIFKQEDINQYGLIVFEFEKI